ncbi:hypothetical protein PV325_010450 [Microctonus aethiopoides]|nr:hypothetical protein PV325_010450 [Microctonus aethiopoides]
MEVTSENEIINRFIDTFELHGNECRLCLKKANQIWELFENDDELPKKIMACAHVQINQGDGLPTIICLTCRQLLDVSYNFKFQVEKSDEKLRQMYHLKTSSFMEYQQKEIGVNDSVIQSVNQVAAQTINDVKKMNENESITDNLKNSVELTKFTASGETIDNRENCISMVNRLDNHNFDNNHQEKTSFNVDINHGNYSKNKHCYHNNDNVIKEKKNANEKIIDISLVEGPKSDLIEKMDHFDIIKDKNCVLADEENELSNGDENDNDDENENDNQIYHNNEMFVEQEEKVDFIERINEENKKKHNDKDNASLDNDNDEDDEDDEDDNDEDDDGDNDDDENDDDDDGDNDDEDDDDDDDDDKKDHDDDDKLLTSKHKCLHCVKEFTSTSELRRHVVIVHNNNKTKLRYVCYMCDKQFATVIKLKNHVLRSHDSLKNDEMNKEEVNKNEYNEESGEKMNEKNSMTDETIDRKNSKFSCKHCPKQFTYEKPFLTHAKRHPEYMNQQKNKSMRTDAELMSRNIERERLCESEDDDMPLEGLQCTQCGKLFATKRNLTRHLSTHTGLKFNCKTCTKEFSRLDKLKEHEQIKHKNEFFGQSDDYDDDDSDNEMKANGAESSKKDKHNRPHKCSMCPKAFAQAQSLTNHMERHKRVKDTQKRFLCEVCSKCFAQSGSLVAHMRTHTGVKPYVCNVCNRAFTKSTYLQLHLRTHSGEKPYICQYCSRAFARANTLARHITMHTGEAKYHCQICMKSFRRLTSLNEHTYTHTGQRPYACKICTKRYNNAGSLYAHTKKCKAQQLNTSTSSTPYHNITVHEDVNNQNVDNTTSAMLIYSQRKIPDDVTNVTNAVGGQSITASSPSFTIANNVHNQKSSLPTNIIQQYTIDHSNVYTLDAKQYKNPYYTIYPGI